MSGRGVKKSNKHFDMDKTHEATPRVVLLQENAVITRPVQRGELQLTAPEKVGKNCQRQKMEQKLNTSKLCDD